jgi:hypothetical protein
VLALLLPGCERGCARDWLVRQGVLEGVPGAPAAPGAPPRNPLSAIDCSDGLARCSAGVVEVSELAVIPQPCNQLPPRCVCPWSAAATCEAGCVAEGAEVVVDRSLAARQLCAPSQDAGTVMRVTPAGSPTPAAGCSDGQLFRCVGRDVVSCRENAIVGTCVRGCFAPDAVLDDSAPLDREAAFAILCSR